MKITKHFFTALVAIVPTLFIACNKVDYSAVEENTAELQIPSRERDVNVTPSEAATLAELFANSSDGIAGISSKAGTKHSSKISTTASVREDGQDLMYVFNYEDGGWVIVGSTREYYPILAYSDEGKFELQDDMGPVDVWLDETKVSIKNCSRLSDEDKEQMRSLWSHYEDAGLLAETTKASRVLTKSAGEDSCWNRIDSLQALYGSDGWTFTTVRAVEQLFTDLGLTSEYNSICYSATQNYSALNETIIGYQNPVVYVYGPFLNTQWKQGYPFNKLCPNHVSAGCAVIAAAQVMKYYEYPYILSWEGTPFTWADIPVAPSANSKQPELIMAVAQACQIDYINVMGATPADVADGLESLGYDTDYDSHNITSVKNEIVNHSRPVLMYGVDTTTVNGVHMWVCDGVNDLRYNQVRYYTENQPNGAGVFTQGMYSFNNPGLVGNTNSYLSLHMNWGWSGSFDGWFASYNVNSGYGNYNYQRINVYVSVP